MKTLFTALVALLLTASPALAQRFPRIANTLQDMVASNPNVVHTNVFVADINRGGMFFWLAGSTLATNTGTVFPSTFPGIVGRYIREFASPLDVRWFGATSGDATDDSVAGQAAIDLASTSTNSNEVLFRPGGTGGYIMGNLIAKSNVRIRGAAYVNIPAAATNFLSISNVINVEVRDLTIYANSTNHTAFWLANDAHEINFHKVFVTGTPIWSSRATWSGNGPYAWVIQRSYINEWVSCSAEFMGTEVWFNSDNAHRNSFFGCSFKNANHYNVLATISGAQVNSTGHGNSFTGGDIEGPSTFVRLTAAEVNFDDVYFEGPSTAVRQIEIDGASIVTIENCYMWDTYLGFSSTDGPAAGLTLSKNTWDGIGSSTNSPFIRYTSDSSAPLILDRNKSKSAVVIYRTGQWWDGAVWQNLTNNEEEIRDSNLIYDPVALMNRRAYSGSPFLDSQRFNHPLGVNRYPDNALGLALKTTTNPTNAANLSLLAWENAYVSAGHFLSGIDISNRLAFRWWPTSNSTIFALDSDGYAALPNFGAETNRLLFLGPAPYNRILPVTNLVNLTFDGTTLTATGGGGGATNAITQLNGLTNASQTLVDGGFTSSSSVVSAGTVHTFSTSTNFPMLSVSNNINMGRESLTGTTPAINWATQQTKVWALSANSTPTFSNTPTDTNSTRSIFVVVTNTTFTINWDDAVYWPPADAEINPMSNTVTTFAFKWDGVRVLGYADQLVSGGSGSGTVTSVAATVPGGFSITGSPITTAGTLAIEASGEQPYYFLRGNFDGSSTWDNSLVYSNSNDTVAASFGSVKRGRAGDATGSPASGGILGQYRVGGWNTSANVLGGGLSGFATENWTATANGHDLRLYVVSNTTAVTSLAMTIGQDRKVKLESASTANSFLGTDGSGNIVITNAPAGGGGTNSLFAYQEAGTGGDFNYSIATDTWQKVTFGTTGPSFTITNAGSYQVIMTVAAYDAATFSQRFFVTNVTDGVLVYGDYQMLTSSGTFNNILAFQVTTTGANRVFDLWGRTANSTYTSAGVIATKTLVDVIAINGTLGGGSGTGDFVGPASSTDDAIVRFDGTTGKLGQNSSVTIEDDGDIIMGDGSEASMIFALNMSGVADPSLQFSNSLLTLVNASLLLASSASLGFTGRAELVSNADGYFTMRNDAATDFEMLRFGGTTTSFPGLQRTNTTLAVMLADESAYSDLLVASEAYGAPWDGSQEVPTKNDLYDKIQTLGGGDNWVASGTTNSTLPGIALLHSFVSTNPPTIVVPWLITSNMFLSTGGLVISNTMVIGDGGKNITTNAPWTIDPTFNATNGGMAGQMNVLVGTGAGKNMTSANGNTFVGMDAGRENTDGSQNTYIGWVAGRDGTRGYHNAYIGVGAGMHDTSTNSAYNTIVGCDAGLNFSDGDHNTMVGNTSGNQSGGKFNSFFGYASGLPVTNSYNVFLGTSAGALATNSLGSIGIGSSAGRGNQAPYNVFVGLEAGLMNSSGSNNVYIGKNAGRVLTVNSLNTIIGTDAADVLTSAAGTTGVGAQSLTTATSGDGNHFFGYQNLFRNATGSYNTTSGYQAGFDILGSSNTVLGARAAFTMTNGGMNTIIGTLANTLVGTTVNGATAIGANAVVTNSFEVVLGGALGGAAVTNVVSPGSFTSPIGFGSLGTGTVTTSDTGATNTSRVAVILYVTAATSAALTDNAGTTEFSGVTISAFTPIRVQPRGTFIATGVTYATGTSSHAW